MPEHENDERKPRSAFRRAGRAAFILVVAGIVLAGLALVLMPVALRRFSGGDDWLIQYERVARRWRADLGWPMPGQPDLARFSQRLSEQNLKEGAPVLIRIFKREFELELWLQRGGQFQRFAVYPICRWSGWLGPKLQQGDSQAPEGFYTVDATALNPNSAWHRSFNLGYPNAFDRAHGRTGSLIMVHGGCASIGCFAMTNAQIDEIWRLVTGALSKGQKRFQVQVYPFRMSAERLAAYRGDPDFAFWKDLKAGGDLFHKTHVPPKVSVCQGRYRFLEGEPGSNGDAPIEDRCSGNAAKG
jgi:murein L,D-transpeptidase YafK